MKCPHCSSADTTWKAKAAKWECNACEERFPGESPAPDAFTPKVEVEAKAAKPKRIFFSYGHDANRELVDRFKADLESRGHRVWIDYKEIGSWDDWKGTITRGIHDAEMAIAFLSLHSTRDPGVCRNEVAMALQHFGKVYPVLVEQVPLESIPVTIAHLQWPDLSRWREYRDQVDLDFERFYEEKFLEIVSRVEGEAGRFASEAEVLRRVLAPSGFEGRFARHLAGFTGREWVFDAYEHWLDHQPSSRVFWVKAGPGFGKTALAVQMANRHRAAIVGTWFCDHQSVELRDPMRALQTIAYQLALRWDDYRARLLPRLGLFADSAPERIEEARQELAKKSLHDLFSFLISEPMAGLIWREHKLVILVDALDEGAEADGTNPLAALISGRFLELPEWIGFVVTSRPDASVVPYLQGFKPFAIEARDARNTADLHAYCSAQVGPLLPAADCEKRCAMLVEKSAGMMLYLRLVAEGLREGTLDANALESLESGLPGLHSRYHAAFESRLRKDFQETVQPLLRLVMAAPGPIPSDLAQEVLGWDRETAVRARALAGSYLVEDGGGLSLFHKTLGEWLGLDSAGVYFTDAGPAAKQLGEFLWKCFDERGETEYGFAAKMRREAWVGDWLPKLLGQTDRAEDWGSISSLASWFREKIQLSTAEALFRRALVGREKDIGAEHPDTLKSVKELGRFLHYMKGDWDEAEVFYRRAMEGREKTLGIENADTQESVEDLRHLLRAYKDDVEGIAELDRWTSVLFRRALDDKEKALGIGHQDVVKAIEKLGYLLKNEKFSRHRFSKKFLTKKEANCEGESAEALYRRALEAREKALGIEHADTLVVVVKLGDCLWDQNDYKGAELLYRQALAGMEKALGSEHLATLLIIEKLGSLLSVTASDREEEVKAFYSRVLNGREKALGAEHEDTLKSKMDLGGLLTETGDYEGAEAHFGSALKLREKKLGIEHPDTLDSIWKLGNLLYSNKKDSKGRQELYRWAFEVMGEKLGIEHPITLRFFENHSLIFLKDDIQETEVVYRRILARMESALGAEHPDTIGSMYKLGSFLRNRKKDYKGAEALYLRALRSREKALGAEHEDTVKSMMHLGHLLTETGDYEGAELLYGSALKEREKRMGADHRETLFIVNDLGFLLNKKNRRGAALELLRTRAALSDWAEDGVRYNLACYECLEGNLEEAKRLIQKHLALHPDEKDRALADDDLVAIRDFIEAL